MMTTTSNLQFLYQKATQLHQKKQAAQAWEAYQRLFQKAPNHLSGLLGISQLLYQNKKYSEAIPYLERLLQLHPVVGEAWYLLGLSYSKTKHQKAANCLQKASKILASDNPKQIEILYQLAKIYRDQEEIEKAEKIVQGLLEKDPHHSKALTLQGQFFQKKEDLEAAYTCFEKVLKQVPKNAPAHYNFACVCLLLKKKDLAHQHFQQAIALNPNWDSPLREYAQFLSQEGKPKEAERLLKRAIQIAPNSPENYRFIAQWYAANGDRRKAIKYFSKLVKMQPEDLKGRTALGNTLAGIGAYGKAIPQLRKALEMKPTAEIATALAGALIANSQLEVASPLLQQALQLDADYLPAIFQSITLRAKLCDWKNRKEDQALWQKTVLRLMESEDEKERSFTLPLLDMNHYELPMSLHRQLNEHAADQAKKRTEYIIKQTQFKHQPHGHERLRIGYISPDFRHHPVGRIAQHIFKAHHRDKVEVYAYSLSDAKAGDDIRAAIKAGVDHFREVPFASNTEVAKMIYADEIDVLIDLGGYTAYARPEVSAAQAAPVQAHFLGYPNTSGADFFQYIIADHQLIPEALEEHYTEKVVRLPHAFPGAIPLLDLPQTGRAEEGIAEDAFVFAAFNRPEKYDPAIFYSWLQIVNAVPNGILWLGVSPTVQKNLRQFAEDLWLDISRVKFSDWADYPTFLHRLRLSDLFLDTLHYSAGATAVASIAMGTPVLTVTADNFTSRMGATVAAAAQQEALICADLKSFEQKAIALATDPAQMQQLREQLRTKAEQLPLFDMDSFATSLETAYQKMYDCFIKQVAPQHIDI